MKQRNLLLLVGSALIAFMTLPAAQAQRIHCGKTCSVSSKTHPVLDCGGGTYCNPGTHWLKDKAGQDPVLLASGLQAGDVLSISSISGSIDYGGVKGCPDEFECSPVNTCGGSDTIPKFNLVFQFTNDKGAVVPAGVETPGDRNAILAANFSTLTVPAGATKLYGSYPDSKYGDNVGDCTFSLGVATPQLAH